MTTFFIRHKFEQDDNSLCDSRRIAIRFSNLPISGNRREPDVPTSEFRGAYRTAVNYMCDLRDRGGYVFAEYGGGLLGEDRLGEYGCLIARVNPQNTFTSFTSSSGYTYEVSLELDRDSVGFIRYSSFPVLLAIRPPFSTICQPSRTFHLIAGAYFGDGTIPATKATEVLHPGMVEQLCTEYLRKAGYNGEKLDYCTLKPGKTLAVVDVAGRMAPSGQKVFAQVKNADLSEQRSVELANQLRSFIGDADLGILFAGFSTDHAPSEGVARINLSEVVAFFRRTNPQVLDDMIGFGEIETMSGRKSISVDWKS